MKPNKEVYKSREKATVDIHVKTASGQPLPPGAEVVFAAVDEALMRLKENTSWNLLAAMMKDRPLLVATSSGQNHVIGRRHFGAKAQAPGGGGGNLSSNTREIFDPVLFYEPRVKLNAEGRATVSFPLNDALTSFRFVAVATAGAEHFGEGRSTVRATKDLILQGGFAPMMREGDQINNVVSVRNTTSKLMKVHFEVKAPALADLPKLEARDIKPGEAQSISLPFRVPRDVKQLTIVLGARDEISGASDAVEAKIRVDEALPTQVVQATLFQLKENHEIPIKLSDKAIAGKGGVHVQARETLAAGLGGVRTYMESYPYTCLEQRISRAVVLNFKKELARLIEELPGYLDSDGLLKFFPTSKCGSANLSRYVLDLLHENGVKIPEGPRSLLIGGLKRALGDELKCTSWWDRSYENRFAHQLDIAVMDTLSRYSAFTLDMLSSIKVTPNLWANETLAAWVSLLSRESNAAPAHLEQAKVILRSRINFQGSIMALQHGLSVSDQWQLLSSNDQEAAKVFGLAVNGLVTADDVGRLARGMIARLHNGHFDTTTANAWAMTIFRQFSAKFEKVPLGGKTEVTYGRVNGGFDWSEKTKNKPPVAKVFLWPLPGRSAAMRFEQKGSGQPWVNLEARAAIPLKGPVDLGYSISRKVQPVLQHKKGHYSVGDVLEVQLTVRAKTDQAWVVIRDPMPAGATHLGAGLDGSSEILNRKSLGKKKAQAQIEEWPTEYEEKSLAHFTTYAAYLPRGTYSTTYRLRLNSAGQFRLPPTRAEALYAPEVYGETPNSPWMVANAP